MEYTTNLNLKKPSGAVDGDFINVADINGNMDDIDTAIGDHIADTDNPHAVTKAQVGLENVDNTADANKPVSNAQQMALDLKATTLDFPTAIATVAGWNGSAPFVQAITVSGIIAADKPIYDVVMSGNYASDLVIEEDFAKIYRLVTTNNTVTFYAKEKPTVNLNIQLKVVR